MSTIRLVSILLAAALISAIIAHIPPKTCKSAKIGGVFDVGVCADQP